MINVRDLFKDKKVTLMGLGLLGRGVGDAEFLARAGAEITVTDLKTENELAPSLDRLKKFTGITYHLGEHRMEDFERRDLIIRAPNAPLDSPFLAHARRCGIPIEMDSSLFAKLSGAVIVGITGTRGKSTVTHLIHAAAKAAGKNPFLGGNERDVATLSLLETVSPGDLAVLELDSWQLQGFAEDGVSPHIAVWTNFMRDHMNYYRGDMDRYFEDKAAIARFQKKGDVFVTSGEIRKKTESRFGQLAATVVTDPSLPADWEIAIPGDHNRTNAAYALAALRALGIPDSVTRETFRTFPGLPNRLEFLGEKKGVAFYNDANSTTPDATIAALETLKKTGRPITLIAGGSDKELDFAGMADEIRKTAGHLVLFKGAATDKLLPLLAGDFSPAVVATMRDALQAALQASENGSIVLLSPGATSFGIFRNEYDRGDQFRAAVAAL